MRLWRRRSQPTPPVVLPSLDRLAGLIERVVELVDEVAGAPGQAREPVSETEHEQVPAKAPASEPVPSGGWVAFVSSPHGYTLLDRGGALPDPGEPLDVDGVPHRVVRHAPSPLPGDRRRCVFVEREEPQAADRSFDA